MSIMHDERFEGQGLENLRFFSELRAEGASFDVDTPEEFARLGPEMQERALAAYREDDEPATFATQTGFLPVEIVAVDDSPTTIPIEEREHIRIPQVTPRAPDWGY